MWGPTKKLGWIGLVALKFIGYKQTDKHHDRQAKDIEGVPQNMTVGE